MLVKLTRESVAMGDDAFAPHELNLNVSENANIEQLLSEIQTVDYLPTISGGEATWVLYRKDVEVPIAVVAQQWGNPNFLVQAEYALAQYFAGRESIELHFVYKQQENPDTVYKKLSLQM